MSAEGTVAGRQATRYDCEDELTVWIDNEFGYVLKLSAGCRGGCADPVTVTEAVAIDLEPSFGLGLFDQKCPTPDCTPAPPG